MFFAVFYSFKNERVLSPWTANSSINERNAHDTDFTNIVQFGEKGYPALHGLHCVGAYKKQPKQTIKCLRTESGSLFNVIGSGNKNRQPCK